VIPASGDVRVTRVVAGEVPDGFVEDVGPLADLAPDAKVSFSVETDGGPAARHGGFVDVGELAPDVLVQHGRETSYDGLRRDARINCSRFPPWQAWPHWLIVGGMVASMVATGAFVRFLVRSHRRYRGVTPI
jgi:hypothetical protein